MLDEPRIARIEAAIAAEEAEGRDWTNQSIYDTVGGNYGELAQYLKARRAQARNGDTTVAVGAEEVAAQAPPSLQEQYAAALAAQGRAQSQAQVLRSKATTDFLSKAEREELAGLQVGIQLAAPVIERLGRELATAKEELDIDAFKAAWDPLASAKQEDYQLFQQAVWALFQARDQIKRRHSLQMDLCMQTPPKLQAYLLQTFLPDENTIIARLAQQLGSGWHELLCTLGETRVPRPADLSANDPGVRPLPPRLIQNALNRGRPLERSA